MCSGNASSIVMEGNRLELETLESRMMLSTVQLTLAGQTNQENVDLVVDDQFVATVLSVGGDALAGEFVNYTFETGASVSPSNVKVVFTNDFADGTIDRNVRVEAITIDGVRYESDASDVFSTGTWRASDGCEPGFKQSQWLSCNGFLEFDVARPLGIQGQAGASEVNHAWSTKSITPTFEPVIIAGPPTSNDVSPGVVQVRNITETSFDLRYKEWNYLDTVHDAERLDWLVFSQGRYQTGDGSTWEVGKFDVSGNATWASQSFTQRFSTQPFLFLTVQTQNGAPVVVRARNVSSTGFDVALFEEQATSSTGHGVEVVGYLAIEPGATSGVVELSGEELPYLLERKSVNHDTRTFASFGINLQEEQSQDEETAHAFEQVNALGIGNRLYAQVVETRGADPVALRRSDSVEPTILPAGFVLEEILSDNTTRSLVGFDIDSNGDQYLADQRGLVWLVNDGVRQSTPFLDISDQVSNVNLGTGQMTGFALDPDFDSNGFAYALYTTTQDGESFGRLTRFTRDAADPGRVLQSSARILIGRTKLDGLLALNFHSQGDIAFGTDGSLLFSWGDSASNNENDPGHFNSQNFDIAAGKLFRINAATGRGLATNPFFDGNRDSTTSKTWAYGIRNGFRIEVQPGSGSTSLADGNPGRVVIADVGRNRFEELSISNNGGENFGWPFYEANLSFREGGAGVTQTAPVAVFAHPEARSVIGGTFYQGASWPAEFQGLYFAADFVSGWVRSFRLNGDGSVTEFEFATGIKGITDMKIDPTTGDMLLTGRGRGIIFNGEEGLSGIYRIRFTG